MINNNEIKILIVEDQITDVELALRELKKDGMLFNYRHVFDKDNFLRELELYNPDLILCDYSMPSFDGMTALRLARELDPIIPFIIYTGSINEETAVRCMKEGANDYIIKQFRTRLPLAIKSAIEQSKILKEKLIAENELRESEEKYRALSENALDIVFRFSFLPLPKFDYVSPSLQKITGIKPDELYLDFKKGLFLLNLTEQEIISFSVISSNYKSSMIYKIEKQEGVIVYLETKNDIITNENSHVSIQGIARDVTQREIFQERLKKSEESYRLLFDSNPHSMLVFDEKTKKIIDVNDTAVNEFGYSKEEFLSSNIYLILENTAEDVFYSQLTNEYLKVNAIKLKKKNSEIFFADITFHSLIYKGIDSKIILINDVTQKVIAEQKLIEAKINAEMADKLKTNFLAQMSHEIRTPINVIMNFVGLLKDIVKTDNENERSIKIAFNAIFKANLRIIRTIDLILNMSELQVGAYRPEIKELHLFSDILDRILPDFQGEIDEKHIDFKVNCLTTDDTFLGDNYSVTQIFINLLDNAIKFTKKGTVSIDAFCSNTSFTIEIVDTGIGISESYMNNLFKPFSQEEEGYTRKYEGNGLGLALVKKYCELNNCEISVSSKKGIGTKFTLNFSKITKQK